jgi:hypothetical protein
VGCANRRACCLPVLSRDQHRKRPQTAQAAVCAAVTLPSGIVLAASRRRHLCPRKYCVARPRPVAWSPNRESHVIFLTPCVCSTSLVRFHLLHGVSSIAERAARMETDETFETFFPPTWCRPSPLRSVLCGSRPAGKTSEIEICPATSLPEAYNKLISLVSDQIFVFSM